MVLARMFVLVGSLVVIALLSALAAPLFVNWDDYRAAFEREAGRIVGRPVTVAGPVSARLLPFPSISFSDVRVTDGSDVAALTAERFSMDAELMPFLRGEVLIFDTRVDGLKARLRLDRDGAIVWSTGEGAGPRLPTIVLERVAVTNADLMIERPDAGPVRLDGMNGLLSAETLAGPWRGEGTGRLNGETSSFDFTAGARDEAGRTRLRLDLRPAHGQWAIAVDGGLTITEGRPAYDGRADITFSGGDGGRVARVTGALSADISALKLDDARFTTGSGAESYSAEGRAEVTLGASPRFLVELDGQQVTLDDQGKEDRLSTGSGLAERLRRLEAVLATIPAPTIPGDVRLNLPALIAGDTTFREIRLSASPDGLAWRVQTFSAELPGRTVIEGAGRLTVEGGLFFDGNLTLASRQPTGFARWLAGADDPSIRRLAGAGFTARAELSAKRQVLRDLELNVSGATLKGLIDRSAIDGRPPSLTVQLDGGAVDLDALNAFGRLFVSGEGMRSEGAALDVQLRAGPVRTGDFSAERLETTFRLDKGTLDIDRLIIAGLDGATVTGVAKILDPFSAPVGNADISILGDDISDFVRHLAGRWQDVPAVKAVAARLLAAPRHLETVKVDLVGEISGTGLTLRAAGTTAAGTLAFDLSAPSLAMAGSATMTARTVADDGRDLLLLAGLPVISPEPLGELAANLTVRPQDGASLLEANVTAQEGGDMTIRAARQGNGVWTGDFTLQSPDLEPYAFAIGQVLPGGGFGLPADLSGTFTLAGDKLALDALSGTVLETAVNGMLSLSTGAERPVVTGRIAVPAIDLMPLWETVFGAEALYGSASWRTSDAPFPDGSGFGFDADIDVTAGRVAGLGLPISEARFRFRADASSLSLADVGAKAAGGDLGLSATLRKDGRQALLSFFGSLAGADLATMLSAHDETFAPGSAQAVVDLRLDATASGQTFAELVASASGSGAMVLRNLLAKGLDLSPFAAIIAKAGALEPGFSSADVAAIAEPLVRDGAAAVPAAEAAFTIASGVLRSPPVIAEADGSRLVVSPELDLATMTARAQGTVNDLADAGLEFGFNVAGPLASPQISFSFDALHADLTQKALQREQARVQAIQERLAERQRLRRETRLLEAIAEAEEAARKAEEEAARRAEEVRRAAEAEKAKAEAAAKAAEEANARALASDGAAQNADPRQAVDPASAVDRAPLAPPTPPPLDIDRLLDQLERGQPLN